MIHEDGILDICDILVEIIISAFVAVSYLNISTHLNSLISFDLVDLGLVVKIMSTMNMVSWTNASPLYGYL